MVKRYDLIFSIGEACSCTQALRDSGLQIYSNPLDWLYGSDFDYVVNMKNLTKELKDIRLNLPIWYHVKKKILKILINFLPKKSLRHSLRKKYHV